MLICSFYSLLLKQKKETTSLHSTKLKKSTQISGIHLKQLLLTVTGKVIIEKSRGEVSLRCEISGFCLLSFCLNERFLSFLSLYIFEESVFIFQVLNDKIHSYVVFDIILHFIIQKLKKKHTFLKNFLRKLRNLSF